MKDQIRIHEFKSENASDCVKIIDINQKHMGDLYTVDSLVRSSGYNKYWVAENSGKVIGLIGLANLENGIGMLLSLCVHPSSQGKGIGKKLIETVKKYAEKNRFRKILLLTHHHNKKMMILAISQDFIPEGSLKKHFRTGEDVIYFSYFVS